MYSDIKVVLEQKKAVTGVGSGLPLLLAGGLEQALPYAECMGLDEVEALAGVPETIKSAAQLIFMQERPPEKIAVCGVKEDVCSALPGLWDKNWRQLLLCGVPEENLGDVARLVQAHEGKVLFAAVKKLTEAEKLKTIERCFCLYDPDDEGYAAAVLGATAGRMAGSFTYKNLRLVGVQPIAPSESELEGVHAAGCASVVQKVGDIVTSEGMTPAGEYLDVVDSKDFIVGEIRHRTQKLINQSPKIPYDNQGIALLESVCVNVLAAAYLSGMIAEKEGGGGDYTVAFAPRAETRPEDRAQRRYLEGKFSFALAGAVHTAQIFGTILV